MCAVYEVLVGDSSYMAISCVGVSRTFIAFHHYSIPPECTANIGINFGSCKRNLK